MIAVWSGGVRMNTLGHLEIGIFAQETCHLQAAIEAEGQCAIAIHVTKTSDPKKPQ